MRVTPRVHLRTVKQDPIHYPEQGLTTVIDPSIEAAAVMPDNPSQGAHGAITGGSTSWVYPRHTPADAADDVSRVPPAEVAMVKATWKDPKDPWGDSPIRPHPAGGHARANSTYGKHLLDDPEFQRTGNAPLWYQSNEEPPKVSSLFGTSRGARATHALLGVMGQESQRLYGRLPVPDASLSEDSAPIAKKFIAKGVVAPNKHNPDADANNYLARPDTEYEQAINDVYVRNDVGWKLATYPRVSEEEVLRGQQFMSKALHPAKAPAPAAAEAVDRAEAVASPQAVDETPEPTLFDRDWNKD